MSSTSERRIIAQRERCARQSNEQRQNGRVDRLRQRQSHLEQSVEQKEIRRTSNRQRQRQRRLQLTNEQREMERTLKREIQRLRRHSVSNQNTDTCYYVGKMNELCQYCLSLRFPNEKLNCCYNGKVSLLPLSDYPSKSYS